MVVQFGAGVGVALDGEGFVAGGVAVESLSKSTTYSNVGGFFVSCFERFLQRNRGFV